MSSKDDNNTSKGTAVFNSTSSVVVAPAVQMKNFTNSSGNNIVAGLSNKLSTQYNNNHF